MILLNIFYYEAGNMCCLQFLLMSSLYFVTGGPRKGGADC